MMVMASIWELFVLDFWELLATYPPALENAIVHHDVKHTTTKYLDSFFLCEITGQAHVN